MDKKKIKGEIAEIGVSAAGALVGFAIGGPVGATVGGIIPPTAKAISAVWESYRERQRERLTNIVESAVVDAGMTDEEFISKLEADDKLMDGLVKMIEQLRDTDPDIDRVFSAIISGVISTDEINRRRYLVLYEAIRGLNKVQVDILSTMYKLGGKLSAENMAMHSKVPEIELRNAVRDLELRGMIIDNGEEPTVWALRELGLGIAKMCTDGGKETDEISQ